MKHCCGLIDAHTHWIPESFPAYFGTRKGVAWPSMAPGEKWARDSMTWARIRASRLAWGVVAVVDHTALSIAVATGEAEAVTGGIARGVVAMLGAG